MPKKKSALSIEELDAYFVKNKKGAELLRERRENPSFRDYVPDRTALFNATGTHEIRTRNLEGIPKLRLCFCETCNAVTLRRYGMYGGCIMVHPGEIKQIRCDSCHRYVRSTARVVVYDDFKYDSFCELCASSDSREKEIQVKALRELAIERARKPLDLRDPESIAIAFGASSFM